MLRHFLELPVRVPRPQKHELRPALVGLADGARDHVDALLGHLRAVLYTSSGEIAPNTPKHATIG